MFYEQHFNKFVETEFIFFLKIGMLLVLRQGTFDLSISINKLLSESYVWWKHFNLSVIYHSLTNFAHYDQDLL